MPEVFSLVYFFKGVFWLMENLWMRRPTEVYCDRLSLLSNRILCRHFFCLAIFFRSFLVVGKCLDDKRISCPRLYDFVFRRAFWLGGKPRRMREGLRARKRRTGLRYFLKVLWITGCPWMTRDAIQGDVTCYMRMDCLAANDVTATFWLVQYYF